MIQPGPNAVPCNRAPKKERRKRVEKTHTNVLPSIPEFYISLCTCCEELARLLLRKHHAVDSLIASLDFMIQLASLEVPKAGEAGRVTTSHELPVR